MKRAILLIVLAWSAVAESSHPPGATLRIRFCDEVGLSAPRFARLQTKISAVLLSAGVETSWVYCPIASNFAAQPECRAPLGETEIVMSLRFKSSTANSQALGTSHAIRDGTGIYTTLHYSQIAAFCEKIRIGVDALLPFVALHEVGHLLMGPGHFPLGVMQPHWSNRQLDEVIRRNSFFTEPQQKRLRASLAARSASGPTSNK